MDPYSLRSQKSEVRSQEADWKKGPVRRRLGEPGPARRSLGEGGLRERGLVKDNHGSLDHVRFGLP